MTRRASTGGAALGKWAMDTPYPSPTAAATATAAMVDQLRESQLLVRVPKQNLPSPPPRLAHRPCAHATREEFS
eukprot:SAG31_NODE_12328_length_949_cov_1.381176_1_plen_73_part_10